jgi:beta-lactam-binding protein with PASTA domain
MARFTSLNCAPNVIMGYSNPDGGILETKTISKPKIVTPQLIGLTQAQATNALQSAGLVLGTVTLTTGPVTAQSTAVYTNVNRGTVINITLTS